MERRPPIKNVVVNSDCSPEEIFQNTVIRQIVKMKHDLIVIHTKHNIHRKRKDFNLLGREDQLKFLNVTFNKDQLFKSELKGVIIGHLSIEEYSIYSKMANAVNRRILSIIRERMIDHLDVLTSWLLGVSQPNILPLFQLSELVVQAPR